MKLKVLLQKEIEIDTEDKVSRVDSSKGHSSWELADVLRRGEGTTVDVLLSPADRDCLANELRFGDSAREQVE